MLSLNLGSGVSGFLSVSGFLTTDQETFEFLDVGKGQSQLLLGAVEESGGVFNTFGGLGRGLGVVGDLTLVFGEKLIALSSLHVVDLVSFALFSSDLLRELIDKSEDITNHSVSGKVKL